MRAWSVSLDTPENVKLAKQACDRAFAKGGMKATFAEAKRTNPQNDRMWTLLEIIAEARPLHHGVLMSEDDYKDLFMHSLFKETRIVPDIDGNGMVMLGRKSSRLTIPQFSDLFDIIHAFAAREGIDLKELGGPHND